MERVLRGEEGVEVIFLPVRHHSPACAFHVRSMIETLRPEYILIEGPENATRLIPVMTHEETKAPFAVYYSYQDEAGRISEEKGEYKCYYPFLDYSPELVAMRAGKALEAEADTDTGKKAGGRTCFIDLPYADILAATQEGRGMLREQEKSTYNDDYMLSRNAYLKELCEKAGMRGFDEFWEKYFEIEGLKKDASEWFDALLTYCRLARENTPEEVLRAEGTLSREAFMAGKILTYIKETPSGGRIVVVTGGFHTPALAERLNNPEEEKKTLAEVKSLLKTKIPEKTQGVYLMPYTMEAADALNGYASGMPYPGFYERVWETLTAELTTGEKAAVPSRVYEETVFDDIIAAGKATRREEGYLSTYDEICACNMAQGLALLRGKSEPGAYELQDAVLSCFVKGEYSAATDTPMQLLRGRMQGRRMGKLCSDAEVPPIVHDFERCCKKLGIRYPSTQMNEVTLSLFAKKKHRGMSLFFHRTEFLQTEFAHRVKGPNLQQGRDKNLLREIWKYKWSAQVGAALIEASVYGGTVEEAVSGLLKSRLKKDLSAKECGTLLTKVFEMGLEEQIAPVYARVGELILKDTDFYSLTGALKALLMLEQLKALYAVDLEFASLMEICVRKLNGLLPSMSRIKEEDLKECMEACKLLNQVTGKYFPQEKERFAAALLQLLQDGDIQPGLHGCAQGLLYGLGRQDAAGVDRACQGYLTGTKEQVLKTAQFFRGLFFTARDLVFLDELFLKRMDEFLGLVGEEEFLKLLPELRMAFAYFTPGELDRIAETAAGLHGESREGFFAREIVAPGLFSYGQELEAYVKGNL